MALVSRGTIKDKAKSRSDMEDSDFISDTEWNVMFYDSVCALVELVSRQSQDHYLEEETITASGLDTVDLPNNVLQVRGMDQIDGESVLTMEPFMLPQRNMYSNPLRSVLSAGSNYKYRLQGSTKLRIIPRPDSGTEFRLWYTPTPDVFSSDASTFHFFNAWDEWVVLDLAIKALAKEQADASHLITEREKVEDRIKETAGARQTDVGDQVIFPDDIWNPDWS